MNTICGYTQDGTDDFDWTRGSGKTSSTYTGPTFDHTYGTNNGMLYRNVSKIGMQTHCTRI